jgi:hypothetical protein
VSGLPAPEALHDYARQLFTDAEKRRAAEWASTPDGRRIISELRNEFTSSTKPVTSTGA